MWGLFVSRRSDRTPKSGETGSRLVILARIRSEAEVHIRLQRVESLFLKGVCTQLVDETDPTALMANRIEEDPPSLGGDRPQRRSELDPTIAPQRAERVSGDALGVHTAKHPTPIPEVPLHERKVNGAGPALECAALELAGRRRQEDSRDFAQRLRIPTFQEFNPTPNVGRLVCSRGTGLARLVLDRDGTATERDTLRVT